MTRSTDTRRAIALRTQLQLVLQQADLERDATLAALTAWLGELPRDLDDVDLEAAVRGDLGSVVLAATAPPPVLFEQISAVLDIAGASATERALVETAGAALAPARAGGWLEIARDHIDGGWRFDDELVLAVVAGYLPATPAHASFSAWARAHGVATVQRLTRSLGAENPATEVLVAMPDVDAADAIGPALGLRVDPALLELAGGITHVRAARVAFTATGVARFALRFEAPERAQILALCDRSGGIGREGDKALVMIEAALAADDGPAWADVIATSAGAAVELVYADVDAV